MNFLKKSVFFIGRDNEGRVAAHATGFLITVEGFYHLVTAKHVVRNEKGNPLDDGLLFFFNNIPGTAKLGIQGRSIDEIKKHEVDWIFHENQEVDIAIIPIKADPASEDITPIPDEAFVMADRFAEGQDIFFLSYQPGIEIKNKINPIVRKGIVSLINDDKTFYIDGFAFPGNSGSPVFHKPPLDSESKDDKIDFKTVPGLVGIIGAYLPYSETAVSIQTGRPRVIFEDNTGLSIVWSVGHIVEIIQSKAFKAQLEHVKILSKKDKKTKPTE